ncbi:MAG: hypothetical protein EBY24_01330 [Betaproteobacteria bacterium]|nr:hypothetical protein [Betaproteobacteria bacterium]
MAIRAGDDHWVGVLSHHLFKKHPVGTASPQRLKKLPLDKPSQLGGHMLLDRAAAGAPAGARSG